MFPEQVAALSPIVPSSEHIIYQKIKLLRSWKTDTFLFLFNHQALSSRRVQWQYKPVDGEVCVEEEWDQ